MSDTREASGINRVFQLAAKRYLTSFRIWLYASPFLVIGLVFTELSSSWTLDSVAQAIFAGLVGHLALGLCLLIAGKTVLHPAKRSEAGWRQVLGVLAVAAIVRAIAIAAAAVATGIGDWDFLNRIPTSIALVGFSYTLACYSSELWASYRQRRKELLYSIAIGDTADQYHDLATSGLRGLNIRGLEADIDSVQRRTLEALREVRQQLSLGNSNPQNLTDLLTATDRDWRDVSHRAWSGARPTIPKISLLEILRTLAISKPISLLVLASGPVYGYLRVFNDLGTWQALAVFLVWLLGSLAIAWLTNQASVKVANRHVLVFVVGLVLLFWWGAVVGLMFMESDSDRYQLWFVAAVSTLFAVAMGVGPALERSGQKVLDQLEQMLGTSTVRRLRSQGEMFVLARRIGAYLHSEVRGDFLRLAMQLRSALENADKVLAGDIVKQMEQRITDVELQAPSTEPLATLADFLNNWGKVIKVTNNLNQVSIPSALESKVEVIVMEGVNDAVRHGGASWIDVRLDVVDDSVNLEIESDSTTAGTNSPSGIGSQTMAQLAPKGWSKGVSESGSFLLSVKL